MFEIRALQPSLLDQWCGVKCAVSRLELRPLRGATKSVAPEARERTIQAAPGEPWRHTKPRQDVGTDIFGSGSLQ
jgi:hypothetical protein